MAAQLSSLHQSAVAALCAAARRKRGAEPGSPRPHRAKLRCSPGQDTSQPWVKAPDWRPPQDGVLGSPGMLPLGLGTHPTHPRRPPSSFPKDSDSAPSPTEHSPVWGQVSCQLSAGDRSPISPQQAWLRPQHDSAVLWLLPQPPLAHSFNGTAPLQPGGHAGVPRGEHAAIVGRPSTGAGCSSGLSCSGVKCSPSTAWQSTAWLISTLQSTLQGDADRGRCGPQDRETSHGCFPGQQQVAPAPQTRVISCTVLFLLYELQIYKGDP